MLWLAATIALAPSGGSDQTKMPQIGEPAPNFEAVNQDGKKVKLADSKGKWVIIAFFVKAKTHG